MRLTRSLDALKKLSRYSDRKEPLFTRRTPCTALDAIFTARKPWTKSVVSRRRITSDRCPSSLPISNPLPSTAQVEDSDYKILRKYLPGPYTFVLNATRLVPRIVLTKRNEVGIRIPDNKICQALVSELGNPILSSSVRLPDEQLLWDPKEIDRIYKGQVDLVVDGGDFVPEPSTVISLVDGAPVILHEGKGDITPFL